MGGRCLGLKPFATGPPSTSPPPHGLIDINQVSGTVWLCPLVRRFLTSVAVVGYALCSHRAQAFDLLCHKIRIGGAAHVQL
jgi:hypothetical protein